MAKSLFLSVLFVMLLSYGLIAQDVPSLEAELKKRATALFEEKAFDEARPMFAQLLSLYTKDTEYNFKYGAALLESTKDKHKPISYLEYAANQRDAPPLAYYYLARAYHLNYNFDKAIRQYKKFKQRASRRLAEDYKVDRQIEMCNNGNQLLGKINEVQVLERKVVSESNFFRVYELEGIKGKIIAKPEAFMSKEDKKRGDRSIIFLPEGDREVYFSSYGRRGDNGRDIYKATQLGTNEWSEPVNIGPTINTPYDEDYVFLHPDKKTLYFASKGHNSMGGYDLFKSTYDETAAKWSKPVNLDFALSSVGDDILFISDKGKTLAYFASNRNNDAGKITVYKVKTKKKPADLSLIKGKVYAENKNASNKAKITVTNTANNSLVGVFRTDKSGAYQIEIPENGGTFKFSVATSKDQPIHSGIVEIPEQDSLTVLGQELRLIGDGKAQELQIKNIFDGSFAQKYQNPGALLSPEMIANSASLEVNMTAREKEKANQNAKKKSEAIVASAQSTSQNKESTKGSEKDNSQLKKEGIQQLNKTQVRLAQLKDYKNALYSRAAQQKERAENKFELLKTANNHREQVEEEGQKSALKAALLFEQAEHLKRFIDEKETALESAKSELNSNDLSKVNAIVEKTKTISQSVPKLEDWSEQQISVSKQEQKKLNRTVKSKEEKKHALEREQEVINDQIATLRHKNSEDAQTEIKALKKDSADLSYRVEMIDKALNNLSADISIYQLQEKEIINTLAMMDENQSPQAEMSSYEIDQLRNELKTYRDENKLAYIKTNQRAEEKRQEPPRMKEINEKYSQQVEQLEEDGVQAASVQEEREVYGDWIAELKKELNLNEKELKNATSEEERARLSADNKAITKKINEKQAILESLPAKAEHQAAITNNQNAEKSDALIEEEAKAQSAAAEVNENTIVDDDFSTFNIDQNYAYLNQKATDEIVDAKKALQEAKTLKNAADEKIASVYELETVEAREQAFRDANTLEQKSKEKEIESIKKFSEANEQEYINNAKKIGNANRYSSDFNSSKLDVANLLAEEAERYFNQAAELKMSVDSSSRISKREVALQKAYDYELLALKKQKEALNTLELVDQQCEETLTRSGASEEKRFVQTIEDKEVLQVNDAQTAESFANQLQKEASVSYQRADSLKNRYDQLDPGEEKQRLEKEIETLEKEAKRKTAKADLYLKRREQLKLGYTSQNTAPLGRGILKPQDVRPNKVQIDTVNINEEQENAILKSQDYQRYRDQQLKLYKEEKEAEVLYQKAIAFQRQQQDFLLEAQQSRRQAAAASTEQEQESFLQKAKNFDLKAKERQKSIDSLNKIIKVKRYLIAHELEKRNNILADIPKEKQASILYLTEKNKDKLIKEEDLVIAQDNTTEKAAIPDSTAELKVEKKGEESTIASSEVKKQEDQESRRVEEEEDKPSQDMIAKQKNESIASIEQRSMSKKEFKEINQVPRELDHNIFVSLDATYSAYGENKPIPKSKTLPEGLVYKIQVGAFRNPIPQDMFKGFAPLMINETEDGIKRYTAGIFTNEATANTAKEQIRNLGYSDAFIVAYLDGERISMTQARDISGESPVENNQFAAEAAEEEQGLNFEGKAEVIDKKEVKKLPKLKDGPDAGRIELNNIEKVFYTVQLGVFSKALEVDYFSKYAPLNFVILSNGMRRYNTGFFESLNAAEEYKTQVTNEVPDAFVTAYYRGKRISLTKAQELTKK